jgi:hypothetical protein
MSYEPNSSCLNTSRILQHTTASIEHWQTGFATTKGPSNTALALHGMVIAHRRPYTIKKR